MADRGITFSAAMVRALLDGRKTQTRRLVPEQTCWRDDGSVWTGFMGWQDRAWAFENRGAVGRGVLPPHQPGDRLYVREHWKTTPAYDDLAPRDMGGDEPLRYLADDSTFNWAKADGVLAGRHRQAMHMPRWASRLTLLVTDVRVQRLQEISGSDCIAEGIEADPHYLGLWKRGPLKGDQNTANVTGFPKLAFRSIWEALHTTPGTRWEDNPWIYAVTFDVRHGNIDQIGKADD